MLYPIKKKLVNWVDGMKISKAHLQQTEDYYVDTIRDAISLGLTSYNYGLLPPYKGEKLSCDLEMTEKVTNNIEIELRQCNAVTPGGCRIDINPIDHSDYLRLDHRFDPEPEKEKAGKENLTWDVILVVRPFDRKPQGIPNPEETPPRNPDAGKTYDLFIKPAGHVSVDELGMHHLVVGRIIKQGTHYSVDTNYIPPCITMSSHPDLKKYYELFGKYLNNIEVASQRIIQKIQDKENNSDIANGIKLLCEKILIYIAGIHFNYKNKGRFYQPVEIVDTFSSFAHICFVSVNFIPRKKREELLKYFYEWADIKPGAFLELLSDLLECTYNHQDIRNLMTRIEYSLSIFAGLWNKLSTLEYIGQHKENIVVAEKIQKTETDKRSEWTILD